MTYFLRSGNTFRVTDEAALDLHQLLPPHNYIVKEDPFGNLFLEEIDKFEALPKYYGDCLKNTDRILNTFNQRPNATGAMFTGEKGSGKTLLAKNLSIEGYKVGMPTIVINSAWFGDKFNKLIQDIDQPCIILFDEFEKIYDSQRQESVLTLLDGVFPSKKLFVLTCNDKWRIDQHMRNRPGRIFYMIDFRGLDKDFIIEYCNDNLIAKQHIPQLCNIASLFTEFNFDMLKAIVEDMNRYNETPQEAMKILNAKPEYDNRSSDTRFKVDLIDEMGLVVDEKRLLTKWLHRNPLGCNEIEIEVETEDGECDAFTFLQTELVKVDGVAGTFEYISTDNSKLRLTREAKATFNYFGAL